MHCLYVIALCESQYKHNKSPTGYKILPTPSHAQHIVGRKTTAPDNMFLLLTGVQLVVWHVNRRMERRERAALVQRENVSESALCIRPLLVIGCNRGPIMLLLLADERNTHLLYRGASPKTIVAY